jgi:hypothetical protein
MECGAKTKKGEPCRGKPMPNGRCRMHGGNARSGVAHPRFSHGKYSRSMPERLSERYQASLADKGLLHLREEISLLDARIEDVLGRVDTGESGRAWKELAAAFEKAQEMRGTDFELVTFRALGDLIEEGLEDWAVWGEVQSLLQQRRKLVESERKRLVQEQQTITVERAYALVGAMGMLVHEHVKDPAARQAIAHGLDRLLGRGASEGDPHGEAGAGGNPYALAAGGVEPL